VLIRMIDKGSWRYCYSKISSNVYVL